MLNKNQQAFFSLLQSGLWEKDVELAPYGDIDFCEILRLAKEQSVVGLVAAGMEHVTGRKPPKKDVLQFIGQTFQIEQRNQIMNHYLRVLIEQLRGENIYAILVKGQGIAQCYERPLWRMSGDIDLLLSEGNYEKAKVFLIPLADNVDKEFKEFKHLGLTLGGWVVELHGTLHCRLSKNTDKAIDEVQDKVLRDGEVRVWVDEGTDIYLPAPDNDIIFLFTHILKHFYQGGIGLRQICDLSRFLWTYRDELNIQLLEKELHKMGLMSEWKAFAACMVDTLGMPVEAMPLYSPVRKWSKKARRISRFIMEVGNFGMNRNNGISKRYPYVIRKALAFWQRTKDSVRHFFIFPVNSVKAWWTVLVTGIKLV